MQHWQTYYNQNKHLPLHKIMEGYNRLLNEFNERMMIITQQSQPSGAGPGGSTDAAPAPPPPPPTVLVYSPTSQVLDWYDGNDYGGNHYTDVTLQDFQTVITSDVRTLYIHQNTNLLTSIDGIYNYTNLQTIDIEYQNLSGATVDLSGLINLEYLYMWHNTGTSLTLDGGLDVASMTNCILDIEYNNNLTTLNLDGFGTTVELDCYDNPNLTTINFGNSQIPGVYCYSNNLTSLNTSNNLVLQTLSCDTNQLTSLDISSNTSLRYLYMQNNLLTQVAVDQILINLDTNGVTSGVVNLGGTGNAARSSASDTAYNSLIAKSWSITTN